MKRRDVVFAGASAGVLGMAACGAPGGSGGPGNAMPEKPVDVLLWTNGPSEPAVKAQLAPWAQKYPNARVELGYGKSIENLQGTEALVALMAGGDPPHLVKWNRPVTGSAVVKNMLSPIDDFAKRDKVDVKGRFYPAGIAEMTGPIDNKLYGLTYDMDNRLLFWNKSAFQLGGLGTQPPRDFAEFRDFAVRFTRRGATDVEQLGFNASFGTELLYQWALSNGGGQYISQDGKKVTLDAAKNVETLDFLAKLVQAQGGWEAQQAFLSRMTNANTAFTQDKLAMLAVTNLTVPTIYSLRPETQFDVAPMPTGTKSMQPVTWAGGYAWAIPAGVKYPAVAWELLKYMTSEESLAARTEGDRARLSTGGQPFFYGVSVGQPAIDDALLKKFSPPAQMMPLVQRGLDQMKVAKNRPVHPVIAELWQAQKDATAEAVQGKKSASAALGDENRKIQALFDQFWASYKK
ncbi:MAG TPA: extracellular solute-binding protein [Chloroflexota bacterium]|nr:extracellular solute-binding protein [Chloroflexota bacterium]